MWFYILLNLTSQNNEYRIVTLDGIKDPISLMEALKTFKNVRNLRLMNMKAPDFHTTLNDSNEDREDIPLDNMESLVISCMDEANFQVINRQHPNLATLSVKCLDSKSDSASLPKICGFLDKNQQSIQNLHFDSQTSMQLFKQTVTLPQLKLKSLAIDINAVVPRVRINNNMARWGAPINMNSDSDNSYSDDDNNEDDEPFYAMPQRREPTVSANDKIEQNMEGFIKNQGKSLESLKIILNQSDQRHDHWHYVGVAGAENVDVSLKNLNLLFNTWSFLSVLKSLTIRTLKNLQQDADDLMTLKQLQKNVTVNFLGFQFINMNIPQQTIIGFLGICPNVKEVYLTTLNEAILRFCAMNLKNLRFIKCYKFEGDCLKFYEKTKNSVKIVNAVIAIEDGHVFG